MKKWKCEHCGEEIDYTTFDGYYIGDRLLEGVTFIVQLNDDDTVKVSVEEDSKAYFSQLNEKMWMDAAQEFAKDCVFNDILTCPKCKWDVGIDNVIE